MLELELHYLYLIPLPFQASYTSLGGYRETKMRICIILINARFSL